MLSPWSRCRPLGVDIQRPHVWMILGRCSSVDPARGQDGSRGTDEGVRREAVLYKIWDTSARPAPKMESRSIRGAFLSPAP